jgi:hypothetical protein
MQFVIVLVVVAAVVLVVGGPLRRDRAALAEGGDVGDLEAAREAKYREIRDAELDHRTGKLSDADYQELDSTLRAEAVEILKALDRATIP